VDVKLFEDGGELYVLAKSTGRQAKETAMRRKRLARLLRKLRAMRHSLPSRDQLLMRIGAAKTAAGRAFGFVHLDVPGAGQAVTRNPFDFASTKPNSTPLNCVTVTTCSVPISPPKIPSCIGLAMCN